MNLQLIAVRLELQAILTTRICIHIPWKGITCWNSRSSWLLWNYQTTPVSKELWNYNDGEPDTTPPDFGSYENAVNYIQLYRNMHTAAAMTNR